MNDPALRELLGDVVDGKIVKRAKYDLVFDLQDLSAEFIEVLIEHGYRPMKVQDVTVSPGQRAPAFSVERATAWFGWIFWEKFSDRKFRKLFGSVVRNAKGDWAIQIPAGRSEILYVNASLIAEMDLDHPSGL